jgi:hypothetical protein
VHKLERIRHSIQKRMAPKSQVPNHVLYALIPQLKTSRATTLDWISPLASFLIFMLRGVASSTNIHRRQALPTFGDPAVIAARSRNP